MIGLLFEDIFFNFMIVISNLYLKYNLCCIVLSWQRHDKAERVHEVLFKMYLILVTQASSKRQHHLNKHLYRPSTFLTSYEPPVYMEDDDDRSAYYSSVQDPSADESVSHLSQYRNTTFFLVHITAVVFPPPGDYHLTDQIPQQWLLCHWLFLSQYF